MKLFLSAVALVISGVGFSAHTDVHKVGRNTSVSFETGSAVLTQDSKKELADVIAKSRTEGKIDEVQVAAWSDNPVPRNGEELSKSDQKLAEKRAEAVKEYLKNSLKVSDVDSYNMAERASFVARMFNSTDAELKTELSRGGDVSREEFQVFKDNGKPSKAVVLVVMK